MKLSEIKELFAEHDIKTIEFDFECNSGQYDWSLIKNLYTNKGKTIDNEDALELAGIDNFYQFIFDQIDYLPDNDNEDGLRYSEVGTISFSLKDDSRLKTDFFDLVQSDDDNVEISYEDFQYIFDITIKSKKTYCLDLTEFVTIPIEKETADVLENKVVSISFTQYYDKSWTPPQTEYADCVLTDRDNELIQAFYKEMEATGVVTSINTGKYEKFSPEWDGHTINLEFMTNNIFFIDGASSAKGVYCKDGKYFAEFALSKQYTYDIVNQ